MIRIYGDIMLDRWIYGETNRLSPEAPVPVLLQKTTKENVGGAGNVAVNLSSLGICSYLHGTIGDDAEGNSIRNILKSKNVHYHFCYSPVTTTKTRLVSNNHHIVRLDNEQYYNNDMSLSSMLSDTNEHDVVLVSDYAKGCVETNTIKSILQKTKLVMVDPKLDAERYANAWLVKPNRSEFEKWAGEFSEQKAAELIDRYNWQWLVVTLGKDGIFVINRDKEKRYYKEEVHDVVDVSGAGDTVFAVLAYCVHNGMDVFRAAEYACRAASRVVERSGVSLVTHSDLSNQTVFTNGCFDILHEGHYHLFRECQKLGKKIIVGLNSDRSVRELKGESRPIHSQDIRRQNLLDLGIFHDVVIFDESTPYDLIKRVRPDIIVKGGDYSLSEVIGKDISAVFLVEYLTGYSTTKIISEKR